MHRATETLMRIALSCACAFGLLVAAIAVPALRLGEATPAWAQSGEIDPAHPFAGVASSQQWEKLFIPGTPNIVPNDAYANMTSGEFWRNTWRGQGIDGKLAAANGSGGRGVIIRSPYPYQSAEQHYGAWLAAAGGGTKKTRSTLPDWSGDWQGTADGVLHDGAKVSDVMAAVSDAYKPRFEQLLRGEMSGRHWWPAEFCLPDGFGRLYSLDGATWHFLMDQSMVLINKDRPNNETRYIYTDGRGFVPRPLQFPQWYGASQGFWDGDELVIWTSQVKQWVMTHGLPEYSDQLEAVERMKRFGGEVLVDITLYDPKGFAFPWHDTVAFKKLADWTEAPAAFSECESTNNVYMDKDGTLRERTLADPDYHDLSDPRPWATAFARGEAAATKAAVGKGGN
jgi:hypothetical protein